MDLGAILDADLDAQRDFAPQCIIQKRNSSISGVLHLWLIVFSFCLLVMLCFYGCFVFEHIFGTTK